MDNNDLGAHQQAGAGRASPETACGLGHSATIPCAVGFTGSQHFYRSEAIAQQQALEVVLGLLYAKGLRWMRNGLCIGWDTVSGRFWHSCGGSVFGHPSNLRGKRGLLTPDDAAPERPPLDRNRDIVNESIVLVATPREMFEQLRSGTWATVRYARKRRKPIAIVWPNGTVTRENWPASGIQTPTPPEENP